MREPDERCDGFAWQDRGREEELGLSASVVARDAARPEYDGLVLVCGPYGILGPEWANENRPNARKVNRSNGLMAFFSRILLVVCARSCWG